MTSHCRGIIGIFACTKILSQIGIISIFCGKLATFHFVGVIFTWPSRVFFLYFASMAGLGRHRFWSISVHALQVEIVSFSRSSFLFLSFSIRISGDQFHSHSGRVARKSPICWRSQTDGVEHCFSLRSLPSRRLPELFFFFVADRLLEISTESGRRKMLPMRLIWKSFTAFSTSFGFSGDLT